MRTENGDNMGDESATITAAAGASLASVIERQVAIERKLDTLIELLGAKPRPKEWYSPGRGGRDPGQEALHRAGMVQARPDSCP